jgi:hypothetical protein
MEILSKIKTRSEKEEKEEATTQKRYHIITFITNFYFSTFSTASGEHYWQRKRKREATTLIINLINLTLFKNGPERHSSSDCEEEKSFHGRESFSIVHIKTYGCDSPYSLVTGEFSCLRNPTNATEDIQMPLLKEV